MHLMNRMQGEGQQTRWEDNVEIVKYSHCCAVQLSQRDEATVDWFLVIAYNTVNCNAIMFIWHEGFAEFPIIVIRKRKDFSRIGDEPQMSFIFISNFSLSFEMNKQLVYKVEFNLTKTKEKSQSYSSPLHLLCCLVSNG